MARYVYGRILRLCLAPVFVLAALMAFSAPAHAERKVGVIMTGDIDYYHQIHKAFVDVVGGTQGVNFVVQVPSPEPMAWSNAARKLVVIGSDVIVTYGTPATLTLMKETSNIPIVFAGVYDPKSMNMEGKNATGVSSKVSVADVLEKLMALKPFSKLGVVFNKTEKDTILQVMEIKKLEKIMGFKTSLYNARRKGFASTISGVDALLMTTSCAAMCEISEIISYARKHKVPTASTITGGEDKGILMTFAADPEEQGRKAGEMVMRIINGHKISDIQQEGPSKFMLIVNEGEIASMGLSLPAAIKESATRVIK